MKPAFSPDIESSKQSVIARSGRTLLTLQYPLSLKPFSGEKPPHASGAGDQRQALGFPFVDTASQTGDGGVAHLQQIVAGLGAAPP